MSTLEGRWQHVTPQRTQHKIVPVIRLGNTLCATCGKAVKRVSNDEGPEALKALLRLANE